MKAANPNSVTFLGMIRLFKSEQFAKAFTPIKVTLSGIKMLIAEQPAKALALILVTELGMVTLVTGILLKIGLKPRVLTGIPATKSGI